MRRARCERAGVEILLPSSVQADGNPLERVPATVSVLPPAVRVIVA